MPRHCPIVFSINDTVSAMKFGRFGREDSALVMISASGALSVKILKRTAQFEKIESALAPKMDLVGAVFGVKAKSIVTLLIGDKRAYWPTR